jgi:hypothetical protein
MHRVWLILLILLACAPGYKINYSLLSPEAKIYFGSDNAVSPYLYCIYKNGLPENAKSIQDLFMDDYPRPSVVWHYSRGSAIFEFPADLCLDYVPPCHKFGELQISDVNTCYVEGDFCIEFLIDGLSLSNRNTLFKIEILVKRKSWMYLWDSPPIVGRSGLRAVKATAFVDRDALEDKRRESSLMLIVVKDFLTGEKREAVFKTSKERR